MHALGALCTVENMKVRCLWPVSAMVSPMLVQYQV